MKINYYGNPRLDVLKMLPEKNFKRIIEIGGGDFSTLKFLTCSGNSELWGVDLYDAKTRNIKFIQGSIEDKNTRDFIPDNYFDLLMANDVIEHLKDTEVFFRMASEKLADGGILLMSVPNVRQIRALYHIYIRGNFPREDAGLFDRTHLRWFCKKDVFVFADHNFRIIDCKSVGRLVPEFLSRTLIGEFLGLQNIFVFEKFKS
jgi:SAM-dependent methyltransferase